jgi:YD repeat-containing protein
VTYAYGTIDAATETYEYDAAGNQTAAIDEYGNRTI